MAETNPKEAYLHPSTILPQLELGAGMVVGDFGVGGAAHFAIPVAQIVGQNGGVIMFDVLKSALSAAMAQAKLRGLQNCRAVWSNLEIFGAAKGVADNSLDAGLLVNILHQTKKYKDILAEVHRMLKPTSKLLIVDWLPEAEISFAPPVDQRLPLDHVVQTALSLGFAPLKKFDAGPYHWGVVIVKT